MILSIFVLVCVGCDQSSHARPSALPQSVPGQAIVRGSIRFAGKVPEMQAIVSTERCCQGEPELHEQTVIVNPNATLANVYVYIEGAPATDGSAKPAVALDQVRCQFAPHVLGMQIGQGLRVHSSDPTMHNVHFSPQQNRAQNLSMSQAGAESTVKFDYAEFIRMKCDVHPWMTAWVGVFENPFFAVTGNDGSFEIKDIPPGSYKLVAWHERYGRQEASITLTDDKPLETSFVFGRPS